VPAFRRGKPRLDDLKAVQRRRQFPTVVTQGMQLFLQNRVLRAALAGQGPAAVPLPLRLAQRIPALQRIPARAIGLGVRPEMPDMTLFV
jgi:hypothetical protein